MGAAVAKETLSSLTDHIPGLATYHCAMIGLDSSGKTTVLYRMKYDQYMNAAPTIGFNCEKVRSKLGPTFVVWDVGGQDKLRPLWRSYTRCTDAIIFVVDSCREERLEEAKIELQRICKGFPNGTKAAPSIPVLVLANKQDLPAALDPAKLESVLGLKDLSVQWHLQPSCAVTGEGLEEALERLQDMIVRRRRCSPINALAKTRNGAAATKVPRRVRRSHSHHF